MALMYDHMIEVTILVQASSMQENTLDFPEDIPYLAKRECMGKALPEIVNWEIVETEAGDY